MDGGLVRLGLILGAHGIRGEVRLKSFTEPPIAIATYRPLIAQGGRAFEITRLRPAKDGLIAALKGIVDRNAAEALKGSELSVPRSALPAAEEGAFYLHDLIGLKAVLADGMVVGEVVGMANYGAGDLLDIACQGRSVLVPFTEAFVPEVDLDGRTVTLDLPEDYLQEAG